MNGRRFHWTDVSGRVTALTGGPVFISRGYTVWAGPQVELSSVPLERGDLLEDVRVGTRIIQVPLTVAAESPAEVEFVVDQLLDRFSPTLGGVANVGTLAVTRLDGSKRVLRAIPTAAPQFPEQLTASQWTTGVVTLQAHDPDWLDDVDTVLTYALTPPASFFPIPRTVTGPYIELAQSGIFTEVTVTNGGHENAYPVWTITGPSSGIQVLRNVTTGAVLELEEPLGAGETLIIDTRPGQLSVTGPDGSNAYTALGARRDFWPLAPGANVIRVEMDGATGATSVVLAYRRRWRAA